MANYDATTKFGSGYSDKVGQLNTVGAVWALATTVTLGTADVLVGPTIPANSRIVGAYLAANDCDTGTSLTLDVGDSADDNRLISAATIGQAGGVSTALVVATGMGYKPTAATRIDVTPAAAAAGAGTATQYVMLRVDYVVEEATG
jgi:hypothetical protein